MKILFVLANYYPYIGGAEKITQQLAENLVFLGHKVKVITSQIYGIPHSDVIGGVLIERVPVPNFAKQYLFTLTSLPRVISECHNYDILYTTSNYSALVAWIAAKIVNRPIVITCHEVLGDRWFKVERNTLKAWFYRFIEHFVLKLSFDRYVAVSQSTYNDMLKIGIDKSKALYIYNGVDEIFYSSKKSPINKLQTLCRAKPDDFIYLYFGRTGITKGVDYLLRAVPLIKQAIPNSRLVLILSNEPKNQYEHIINLILRLGLDKSDSNVHLIPSVAKVDDLVEYLLGANCIVVPSLTEGFGLTTAEACALGIPVIATRAGSIPEVISGKHTLVDPASSEALADAVIQAANGIYGNNTARKQFSWKRMTFDYAEIFESVNNLQLHKIGET